MVRVHPAFVRRERRWQLGTDGMLMPVGQASRRSNQRHPSAQARASKTRTSSIGSRPSAKPYLQPRLTRGAVAVCRRVSTVIPAVSVSSSRREVLVDRRASSADGRRGAALLTSGAARECAPDRLPSGQRSDSGWLAQQANARRTRPASTRGTCGARWRTVRGSRPGRPATGRRACPPRTAKHRSTAGTRTRRRPIHRSARRYTPGERPRAPTTIPTSIHALRANPSRDSSGAVRYRGVAFRLDFESTRRT